MIKLSNRLEAISSFIDKKDISLDVGCDHALLDIYLSNKYNKKYYASDIRESALNMARANIEKYRCNKVEIRCGSGLEVLKYVRSQGLDVPIILLTAKGEISDKITGLDLGADDYMAKPFSSEELLARIRALLRRKGEINFDNLISFEDVSLDIGTLKLKKDNDEITLTAKESALIELLIKKAGIVASKEEIINKIWGYESDADGNNVEVYITFLRKKLKFLKSDVSIKAIRNAGYILCLKS